MLKAFDRVQPYLILGFVYMAANILLRLADFFLLAPMFIVPLDTTLFFKCVLNDLIWCGLVFTVFFPLFYLLQLRFQKASIIVCSLIFGTLFLIQIALVFYAFFSGKPLDKEIFTRPFHEMLTTVKSYVNIFFIISLGMIIIASFPVISGIISRKIGRRYRLLFLSSTIVLFLSVFLVHYPYQLYGRNTQSNRFIINRALYFIYEDYNYIRKDQPAKKFDPEILPEFTSENPHWRVSDSMMPFFRRDNIPDVLSPYFSLGKEKPDIVFIIVESLGRGISGENAWSGSFTPFLDSLASQSLYWENCIVTAQRSFGILPSLLGSLPNGNTGFQFGDMPAHYTIARLLKDNGYKINMFYAGYYEFDRVKDFIEKQGVDYYSPYYEEYKASGFKEKNASEWGYADEILFNRSLKDLAGKEDQDLFNLYVTVSTHNSLGIPTKEKYIETARSINEKLPLKQQKWNQLQMGYLASFVYADHALQQFFNEYKERPDFKNTIFVILGDHYIANFGIPNRLSLYHVPLWIYSPLLKSPQRFKSMISVLDVTPSLWSMLRKFYNFKSPVYISWLSDGLDTTRNFSCSKKVLLMQDNRENKEFIYNNYFFSNDSVYQINDKLRLTLAPKDISTMVSEKYELFKTVHSYVYNEKKLGPDSLRAWTKK